MCQKMCARAIGNGKNNRAGKIENGGDLKKLSDCRPMNYACDPLSFLPVPTAAGKLNKVPGKSGLRDIYLYQTAGSNT